MAANSPRCYIMELPFELREKIYYLALDPAARNVFLYNQRSNLLRTCSVIHVETLPILYATQERLWIPLMMPNIDEGGLRGRRISIKTGSADPSVISQKIAKMARLKEVNVFHGLDHDKILVDYKDNVRVAITDLISAWKPSGMTSDMNKVMYTCYVKRSAP